MSVLTEDEYRRILYDPAFIEKLDLKKLYGSFGAGGGGSSSYGDAVSSTTTTFTLGGAGGSASGAGGGGGGSSATFTYEPKYTMPKYETMWSGVAVRDLSDEELEEAIAYVSESRSLDRGEILMKLKNERHRRERGAEKTKDDWTWCGVPLRKLTEEELNDAWESLTFEDATMSELYDDDFRDALTKEYRRRDELLWEEERSGKVRERERLAAEEAARAKAKAEEEARLAYNNFYATAGDF